MVIRKNIVVSSNLTTDPIWDVAIHDVPFDPDEVIVKSVVVANGAGGVYVRIWSSLVNDNLCIAAAPENSVTNGNYDIHFPLGRRIQGSYRFQALNYQGNSIAPAALNTIIMFQLEFVKYG
jgi:hypothetical protein